MFTWHECHFTLEGFLSPWGKAEQRGICDSTAAETQRRLITYTWLCTIKNPESENWAVKCHFVRKFIHHGRLHKALTVSQPNHLLNMSLYWFGPYLILNFFYVSISVIHVPFPLFMFGSCFLFLCLVQCAIFRCLCVGQCWCFTYYFFYLLFNSFIFLCPIALSFLFFVWGIFPFLYFVHFSFLCWGMLLSRFLMFGSMFLFPFFMFGACHMSLFIIFLFSLI